MTFRRGLQTHNGGTRNDFWPSISKLTNLSLSLNFWLIPLPPFLPFVEYSTLQVFQTFLNFEGKLCSNCHRSVRTEKRWNDLGQPGHLYTIASKWNWIETSNNKDWEHHPRRLFGTPIKWNCCGNNSTHLGGRLPIYRLPDSPVLNL